MEAKREMHCITKTSWRTSSFAFVMRASSDQPGERLCGEAARSRRVLSSHDSPKMRSSTCKPRAAASSTGAAGGAEEAALGLATAEGYHGSGVFSFNCGNGSFQICRRKAGGKAGEIDMYTGKVGTYVCSNSDLERILLTSNVFLFS